MRKHYSQDPESLNTFLELGSTNLRADYLRYLVLAAEGGFYIDLDTYVVKPINEWYSESPSKSVRALIGIEYDQPNSPELSEGIYMPVQFCQ